VSRGLSSCQRAGVSTANKVGVLFLVGQVASKGISGARGRALRWDPSGCGCPEVPLNKIKLRTLGYRLVHQVRDDEMAVIVIAVDKRDRLAAYKAAVTRLSK